MKTPMQELLEELKHYKASFQNPIGPVIEKIEKELLKKEKEAMCEFAERYLDSIPKEHPSVEDVYNETFNTKEK